MDLHARPTELSLFSGGGGGLLATQHLLGFRTICYVEIDAYCQRVLQARIADGSIDDAPIWDDIRTFDGRAWRGCVDLLSAGFPCTPFSCAGKRRGRDDKRNLWPDTLRVIEEVRPARVFLENSPDLRCARREKGRAAPTQAGYLGKILGDLAGLGFDAQWSVLSAKAVGACHGRRRLWIVAADADGQGQLQQGELLGEGGRRAGDGADEVGHAAGPRSPQRQRPLRLTAEYADASRVPDGFGWWAEWPAEPALCGVDDGVADRVQRITALGNGQVPLVAATAFRMLSERMEEVDSR